MSEKVFAPFTDEQVTNLNEFQRSGFFHQFTCPRDHPYWSRGHVLLVAYPSGWVCEIGICDYTQDWAHSWMADGSAVHWYTASKE